MLNIYMYYRPQRSCGKVMFLHLSVSHSVHRGGVCLSACWDTPPGRYTPLGRYTPWQVHPPGRYTPLGRYTPWQLHPWADTPPGQVHPPRQSPQRTVRILLECFLVCNFFHRLEFIWKLDLISSDLRSYMSWRSLLFWQVPYLKCYNCFSIDVSCNVENNSMKLKKSPL